MSGVEIALAAAALAFAVVRSVAAVIQAYDVHQAANISKGIGKGVQDFNQANLIATDAEAFQNAGTTKKLSTRSKELREKIREVVKMKNAFDSRLKEAGYSSTNNEEMKKEAKILVKAAKEIQQMVEPIMSKIFGNRLKGSPQSDENLLSQVPLSSANPRHFCVGAILCQQGRVTIEDLPDQNLPPHAIPRKGFVCRYCSLVVGNARTLRLSSEGEVLTSQDLLPASHLAACHSLTDPRSLYRCVICSRKQAEIDFYNASGLERHMQFEHPGEALVMKEEIGTEVLQSDLDALLKVASELDTKDTAPDDDSFDSVSSTLQPSPSVAQTFDSLDGEKTDALADKYHSELVGSKPSSASTEAPSLSFSLHGNYTASPRTPESLPAELAAVRPPSAPFAPDYLPPPPPQPPQTQVSPRQNIYLPPNGQVDNGGIQRNMAGVPYGTLPASPSQPPVRRDRTRQTRH